MIRQEQRNVMSRCSFSLQKERHPMFTASDVLLCMVQFVDSLTDVDQLFCFALCLSAKEVINTLWHCIRRCRFREHECIQTDVQLLCQKNNRFHLWIAAADFRLHNSAMAHAQLFGKLLLGQTSGFSLCTNFCTELIQWIVHQSSPRIHCNSSRQFNKSP